MFWLLCWLIAGGVTVDFRLCYYCAGCCTGGVIVVCWLILGCAVFAMVAVMVDCWLCDG